MRRLAVTVIVTLLAGTQAAPAEEATTTFTTPNGHVLTTPDPATARVIDLDRAFLRLELEASLEDFYAGVLARAEGQDEAARQALYQTAARELQRMILGAGSYDGRNFDKGVAHLQQAQQDLARRLGIQPAAPGRPAYLS